MPDIAATVAVAVAVSPSPADRDTVFTEECVSVAVGYATAPTVVTANIIVPSVGVTVGFGMVVDPDRVTTIQQGTAVAPAVADDPALGLVADNALVPFTGLGVAVSTPDASAELMQVYPPEGVGLGAAWLSEVESEGAFLVPSPAVAVSVAQAAIIDHATVDAVSGLAVAVSYLNLGSTVTAEQILLSPEFPADTESLLDPAVTE